MKLLKKKPALAATAPPHSMCVAGIDFGSQSAKVVLATQGATSRVVAASRLVYPQAVAADPVQQSTFVAGWVERWTARPARRAFCALPLSLTDYEASDLEPSQVSAKQAATEKLNQMLGGGASQVTSDYWQTSAPDRPARLHVLWSSTTLTTGVTRELAKHRIACSILTASPATLGTVSAAAGEGRRLVVDLGCGNATIAFVELGTVSYARPRVAIKASEALTSLSSQMGVSAWAAETMISQWGCVPHSGPIAECVQKSFDSWLRSLRFELQRTLSYLQSVVGQGGPTEILLCGGGAELRGIDRWLSQQLGLPVRVCPPPANATWQAAEPYSPVFATAAALATTGGRS